MVKYAGTAIGTTAGILGPPTNISLPNEKAGAGINPLAANANDWNKKLRLEEINFFPFQFSPHVV